MKDPHAFFPIARDKGPLDGPLQLSGRAGTDGLFETGCPKTDFQFHSPDFPDRFLLSLYRTLQPEGTMLLRLCSLSVDKAAIPFYDGISMSLIKKVNLPCSGLISISTKNAIPV